MKKYLRDYLSLTFLAGIVVALDQWSKALVRTRLDLGGIWAPWEWLTPYARIVHWKNTGAAFGIFQGFGGIFTVLAIVVAVVILYYFPQVPREDWYLRLAMGLQLGGALGNLTDRLTRGFVTDFVSVGTFPVFNVADASISIGVAILVVGMWLKDRQNPSQGAKEMPDTAPPPLSEEAHSE